MSQNSERAPTDYVVMALSPALIMALVGSLVFFLLEILYAGDYTGRLQWILFFFVFGAVLIARIAMQPDLAPRANLYGGILGLLVWVGLLLYVEYPQGSPAASFGWAINLGLIILTWWCAYRLTHDCTFIDDRVGASGQGVLQAAGLEGGPEQKEEPEPGEESTEKNEKSLTWLERYWQYREKQKNKRTPGVWVIYFSLAALPLFGLGQTLIPVEETARRQYTFRLMAIYVGSGLGLLLTTTFLGLRLYLRRRKLQMPAAMTGAWLTVGGLLIAALLLGGTLLPRPSAEYSILDLGKASSKSRQASRQDFKGGDPGEGEGNPGKARDGKGDRKDGQGGKTGDRKDQRGNPGDRQGNDRGGQRGQSRGGSQDGQKGKGQGQDQKDRQRGGRSAQRGDRDGRQGDRNGESRSDESRSDQSQPTRTPEWLKGVAQVLKWVVLGILALVVAFFVLRAILQFCANFSTWARNLLDSFRRFWESLLNLFAWVKKEPGPEAETEMVDETAPLRPFASFSNPFLDGRADRLSLQQLVRYSFAALQSWAAERALERHPGETPLEFATRVGDEVPPLERDVQQLATLFARAVYARGGLPASTREVLEQFWETLARTAEQPLSA
jgi:Domain of unknown function (DUF4129)